MSKTCLNCGSNFPITKKIDGKIRNLSNRKYCIDCSPFGEHNTKQLHKSDSTDDSICKYCEKEFEIDRSRGHRKGICANCRGKLNDIKKKLELLELKDGECESCGYSGCKSALSFHHINPENKDVSIGTNLNKSIDLLIEEAQKCQLLCSNCHSTEHTDVNKCECNECKVCNQRQTRKTRRKKAIKLKGNVCKECQSVIEDVEKSAFHHRNPEEKSFNLSGNNFARSWDSIKSELSKCNLLCKNCHRAKHCTGSEFCNHNHGRFN